jgi:hypothetical protein
MQLKESTMTQDLHYTQTGFKSVIYIERIRFENFQKIYTFFNFFPHPHTWSIHCPQCMFSIQLQAGMGTFQIQSPRSQGIFYF